MKLTCAAQPFRLATWSILFVSLNQSTATRSIKCFPAGIFKPTKMSNQKCKPDDLHIIEGEALNGKRPLICHSKSACYEHGNYSLQRVSSNCGHYHAHHAVDYQKNMTDQFDPMVHHPMLKHIKKFNQYFCRLAKLYSTSIIKDKHTCFPNFALNWNSACLKYPEIRKGAKLISLKLLHN